MLGRKLLGGWFDKLLGSRLGKLLGGWFGKLLGSRLGKLLGSRLGQLLPSLLGKQLGSAAQATTRCCAQKVLPNAVLQAL